MVTQIKLDERLARVVKRYHKAYVVCDLSRFSIFSDTATGAVRREFRPRIKRASYDCSVFQVAQSAMFNAARVATDEQNKALQRSFVAGRRTTRAKNA